MEVNDQNLSVLRDLFAKVLSPDNDTRRQAEDFIKSHQIQPGFPLLLLTLISKLVTSGIPQDVAIRQSAAVLFKNMVKKHWQPQDDDNHDHISTPPMTIAANDKQVVKRFVIEMMTTAPTDVQKQLAEAVTIISEYDFPCQWENLLPELVQKLSLGDVMIAKGVMLTANSIMKRFRYVLKSDELYTVLKICLDGFAMPLTNQFQHYSLMVDSCANDKAKLVVIFETMRLMSRVYFSLNWQDVPEYFEDHLELWMKEFAKFLEYTNPILIDTNEEDEPGPIENLQSAILDNLNLFATKYEEEFENYLGLFTQLVWKRLVEVGPQPKYDVIATSAIKFLTSVCSKDCNKGLFTEPVLKDIIQHIVVKNLMATEADEELFEDNPSDYIRKDMEGSDQDTRRRSAMELLRALMKFFSGSVSQMCISYIDAMLESHRTTNNWKAKDGALHLVLSAAVKSGTVTTGAAELNPLINILGIFQAHVFPEIHDTNVNKDPIIKADAMKLICVFRSHFDTPFLMELFPHLLRFLQSKYVVLQTYAALVIERFLNMKDKASGGAASVPKISKADLVPFYQPLFQGLFAVLLNPAMAENEYVMKCIMRSFLIVGSDIATIAELVLSHLIQACERACRNPVNPLYNHYLFEALALLIRATCDAGPSGTITEVNIGFCNRFEGLLFPTFQNVLAQDVSEFVPYVFQILAQLLAARPQNSGLSDAYRSLFIPLLSPALWERRGNIPALVDLYKAYISRGMAEIVAGNHLTGVLGVFQKLLASKVLQRPFCH